MSTGNHTCTLEQFHEGDTCSGSNDTEHKLQKLYDLRHSCSEFDPDCQCKREKAMRLTSSYYQHAAVEGKKKHKYDNGTRKVFVTGISAVDPRPEGFDRYVDYLSGHTVPNKPSHGYYGKLPLIKVRDPTCTELQNVVQVRCQKKREIAEKDERGEYSMGLFCGMGTTWNPTYQKCVMTPDEYMAIDGVGQPYGNPVYPAIRPEGYKSCFDQPNSNYVYETKKQRSSSRFLDSGARRCRKCNSHRCRFPLTSKEGQEQARLYVRLFRTIYEYNGSKEERRNLRYRIRQLIDDHSTFFNWGIHRYKII